MELKKKIKSKKAKICMIGLGYVGLPCVVAFVEAGFQVLGIDINMDRIEKLLKCTSYISEISNDTIKEIIKKGFLPTSDYSNVNQVDVIIISVPTPTTENNQPEFKYIDTCITELKNHLKNDQLIIFESTSYPGTTQERILHELEKTDYKVGKNFFLAFSPERINPGSKKYTLHNTDRLIGGCTSKCAELAIELYSKILKRKKIHKVANPSIAEASKLFENFYRSTNIAFMNEMVKICRLLKLDFWEVLEAAHTKPFGFSKDFYPGPGVGGHCISTDPFYLAYSLERINYTSKLIEITHSINKSMPKYVIELIINRLGGENEVANSKILILGVAYKKNINDMRESPALDLIILLNKKQAEVLYSDPFISEISNKYINLKSQKLNGELIAKMSCVVLITDHDGFNYDEIVEQSKFIVDTRNRLSEYLKNTKYKSKIERI